MDPRLPQARGPIFDAHLHIVDPRFPLVPNAGFVPEAFDVAAYRARVQPLGIAGGAVVSGSFQAFDQTYLVDALARLGPGFVGVTQLPPQVTDAEIDHLHAAGVRAIRFNLFRGGSAGADALEPLAHRVWGRHRWHVELYVGPESLAALRSRLRALPKICIDHLGLRAAAQPDVLALVESGAYVKATGLGRLDFDPQPFLRTLVEARPDRVVFGTDLPSTRAPTPFRDDDLVRIVDTVGPHHARAVLWDNARALYQLEPEPGRGAESPPS